MNLYDSIGTTYDKTRSADPYIASRLLHHLDAIPGGVYLDVACGTGNYTMALSAMGCDMVGIDQSQVMVETAARKSIDNGRVSWHVSNAEALPFHDNLFSGACCTLAIHHFLDLGKAFREVFRVLKSGRFVLFSCTPEQLRTYWIGHYFPAVIDTIICYMPTLERVVFGLQDVGFKIVAIEPYEVGDELQDHFLYSKKRTPQVYLDPVFRAGMSVFAAKVGVEEVERGCILLDEDIKSGNIVNVLTRYSSTIGDYLFVVADKPL